MSAAALNTLTLTIFSMFFAIILGIVLAVMRISPNPILKSVAFGYLWVFRGTPFLVQVSIIYFAGFPFFGLSIFGGYRWDDISILGFLIAGPAGDKVLPGNTQIGLILLWVAAGLTIYTGWDYFNAGLRYLVEEDERAP